MPRDYSAYLTDIITAIEKIERYTDGITFNQFKNNEQIQDAVVRNLETMG